MNWKLESKLINIKDFCETKRAMYPPIRNGLKETLDVVDKMRDNARFLVTWFNRIEYRLAEKLDKKIKEAKTTKGSKETAC